MSQESQNQDVRQYGLIGYPLGHSFSQKFFMEKFADEHITDASYVNFPIERIGLLPGLIKEHPSLVGLNCTIPYKMEVMSYLDDLDPAAEQVGAVNTIKILRENGKTKLIGYNTDVYGFEESLKPFLTTKHNKALVFGTGGAAKAVVYVLDRLQIPYLYVSRTGNSVNSISYQVLKPAHIKTHPLLINTTPLGMFPHTDQAPLIPYEALTEDHYLFDLVYNPPITEFLYHGMQHESVVKNGLEMLHLQAERAWEIWNSDVL